MAVVINVPSAIFPEATKLALGDIANPPGVMAAVKRKKKNPAVGLLHIWLQEG